MFPFYTPLKAPEKPNSAPSNVLVSLTDQFVDIAWKSPVIKTKCGLRLEISIMSLFKLIINE